MCFFHVLGTETMHKLHDVIFFACAGVTFFGVLFREVVVPKNADFRARLKVL